MMKKSTLIIVVTFLVISGLSSCKKEVTSGELPSLEHPLNRIWTKICDDLFLEDIYCSSPGVRDCQNLCVCANGDISIVFYTYSWTLSCKAVKYIRLDPQGNVLIEKEYPIDSDETLFRLSVISTDDNGALIYYNIYTTPDSYVKMIRLDASGNQFWQKQYLNWQYTSFGCIAERNNGELWAAGSDVARAFLLRMDENGDTIGTTSLDEDLAINSIEFLSGGETVLAGNMKGQGNSTTGVVLLLNDSTEVLWTKLFDYPEQASNIVSLCIEPDNSIVVLGLAGQEFSGQNSMLFAKVSLSGTVIQENMTETAYPCLDIEPYNTNGYCVLESSFRHQVIKLSGGGSQEFRLSLSNDIGAFYPLCVKRINNDFVAFGYIWLSNAVEANPILMRFSF